MITGGKSAGNAAPALSLVQTKVTTGNGGPLAREEGECVVTVVVDVDVGGELSSDVDAVAVGKEASIWDRIRSRASSSAWANRPR